MIVQRISKYSLHVYFDAADVQNLSALLHQKLLSIQIQYLKQDKITSKILSCVIDENEQLQIESSKIVFQIDGDTQQYMLYLLSEFMATGDFPVNECCELAIAKLKYNVQIYFLNIANFSKNIKNSCEI
ncbi:hypothetical protein RFI02_16040 [Acinetobacter sichuanensis]|uniref:hypothetical protein n=1 Tax=Acinetobacter sichuanensis TaxID=2136183 RepID=UPI00280EC9E2|nr:hypothetical protein [Acinetobacter sichuanensis]MDQ9022622.1 hypothetical protein [Acinetobacter sichuanensis]